MLAAKIKIKRDRGLREGKKEGPLKEQRHSGEVLSHSGTRRLQKSQVETVKRS